ncbi:hypothetical protein EYF80_058033 [Liparis tanakae]|uniref:Uncharacterized protein n=1 Tax=Liparis tanakae TaxID=230148 RepID=A0A4Z2ET53_9TELE|nr:hypothetical protein EYF80_058033 [Liparis tanakae]
MDPPEEELRPEAELHDEEVDPRIQVTAVSRGDGIRCEYKHIDIDTPRQHSTSWNVLHGFFLI